MVKNFFIFLSLKRILWQVLCHGHLILLLSTWQTGKNYINPAFVSCSSWNWFLVVIIWYCNKMPILWVCVDLLQWIISALTESENISQKSGCPHFCHSIRNISTKTHIFYKRVSRHLRKFLRSWYINPGMPYIELISLFWLTKHIGSCFTFSLVFLICIYSHLSSDISLNHTIMCIFLFILCTIELFCSTCMVFTCKYGNSRSNRSIKNHV